MFDKKKSGEILNQIVSAITDNYNIEEIEVVENNYIL